MGGGGIASEVLTAEEIEALRVARYKAYRARKNEDKRRYNASHKEQVAAKKKRYYESHKEQIAAKNKRYRESHREQINATKKRYRDSHKEKEAEKHKRYKELNKEKLKIYYQEYYKNNPEKYGKGSPKSKETQERYYSKNRDTILAKVKARYDSVERAAYYKQNRERHIAMVAKYKKSPVGKVMMARILHNRREKIASAVNDLTPSHWITIIEEQNNMCNHCGCNFTDDNAPTVDHIIPVTKGGGLTYENIQALCRSCNARKGDRFECDLKYLTRKPEKSTAVTKITKWCIPPEIGIPSAEVL